MFVVAHKIIYKEKNKHLEINNNWPETKLSTTTTTIFFNKQNNNIAEASPAASKAIRGGQ